jgi:CDP-diacylglycerol---glycerol-3-phosphate 3-phosphatidyltransferase
VNWDGYASAWAGLHGGYDPRRAAPTVRAWLRLAYAAGRLLARAGASPGAVTLTGLLLSLAAPLVARGGPGWPLGAAALVLLAAVADSADGAVAVVTGRATRLGSVYDSAADRLGELCWAAALWAVGAPGLLAALCAVLSWLHEYVRARATAVGMTGIGAVTAGERPTRVSVVFVGLLLAGATGLLAPALAAGTATVAAAAWAVLAVIGLGQLLAAVRVALR